MITQIWSHDCEQQVGSTAQTALQQVASLHAPFGLVWKQSPVPGPPQVPGFPGQANPARAAQLASHEFEQQKGSNAHTATEHEALSQLGFACGVKQEPLAAAPGYPTHDWLARITHAWSHPPDPQQVGST
jgi:hypothetical protein